MSPKVKKIIAREWLIFLVVLLVSPLIVGTYTWRQASKFGFSEDLDHAFYYELSREEALAELRKIAQELHAAGLIPEVGEPEAKPGLGHPVPPMYKKRPLSVYLYNNVLDPFAFVTAVIFVYPIFLFLRSIVWSVRTLRRKEVHPSN